MGLYTFLYENLLYRLYTTGIQPWEPTGIQPPLLVTARLSRYTAHTAHTAHTAIQPYTPYIIQRYTASLRKRSSGRAKPLKPVPDEPPQKGPRSGGGPKAAKVASSGRSEKRSWLRQRGKAAKAGGSPGGAEQNC